MISKWITLVGLVLTGGGLAAWYFRAERANEPVPRPGWSEAYWAWESSAPPDRADGPKVDQLYVYAGSIEGAPSLPGRERWQAYLRLPDPVPAANGYWLVIRNEVRDAPATVAIPQLVTRLQEALVQAQYRKMKIIGIQLDADCPTAQLRQYAAFVRELRSKLPAGVALSITALLDWFRSGTSIGEVLRQVDEFVPQFYDVGDAQAKRDGAIAAQIDAARWGPVFNRFNRHYRIGISVFGRAKRIPSDGPAGGYLESWLTPLELALQPGFALSTRSLATGEKVLSFKAVRRVRREYSVYEPGDRVEYTVPTLDAVRQGISEARRMGGACAGVVFFRWALPDEVLAPPPELVLAAARGETPAPPRATVIATEGGCAAVYCVDLDLIDPQPFHDEPRQFRVVSSAPIEYLLPATPAARLVGPRAIGVTIPASVGQPRLRLGRAVAAKRVDFRIEEVAR